MTKKDGLINENLDRGGNEKESPVNQEKSTAIPTHLTEVKNANASGMGSMGRNAEETTSIEKSPAEDS